MRFPFFVLTVFALSLGTSNVGNAQSKESRGHALDDAPDVAAALAPPASLNTDAAPKLKPTTRAHPSPTTTASAPTEHLPEPEPNLGATMAVAGGGALLGVGGTVAAATAVALLASVTGNMAQKFYLANPSLGTASHALQVALIMPAMGGALMLPAVGTLALTAFSNSSGQTLEGEIIGAAVGASIGWFGVGVGLGVPLLLFAGTQGPFTQGFIIVMSAPLVFFTASTAAVGGAVLGTYFGNEIGASFAAAPLDE